MAVRAFIDTNILVYAYDDRDAGKQSMARELLANAVMDKNIVLSSQVVQEFCHVLMHKLKVVEPRIMGEVIDDVLSPLTQHIPSPEFFLRAIKLYEAYSLSFYDSLIVQAALDLGCDTLYSEDLQTGQKFDGLVVVNPFARA